MRLYSIALLVCMIAVLSGCKGLDARMSVPTEDVNSPILDDLPDSLKGEHAGDILEIIWFDQPFAGDYDRLVLHSGGVIDHSIISGSRGFQSVFRINNGQLTESETDEVRKILASTAEITSGDTVSKDSRIIAIRFSWQSDSHVLFFGDSSCTSEARRLFEIANAAFGRNNDQPNLHWNPCEHSDGDHTIEPTPTISRPGRTTTITEPFDLQEIELLKISWFQRPFSGSYDRITLTSNSSVFHSRIFVDGVSDVNRGQLTDSERQEVRQILDSLTDNHLLEQPIGTSVITLSFPWEGNYHVLTFGNLNCPNGFQRLLEIANLAFRRNAVSYIDYPNPCRQK